MNLRALTRVVDCEKRSGTGTAPVRLSPFSELSAEFETTMRAEAHSEGYRFLDRHANDWYFVDIDRGNQKCQMNRRLQRSTENSRPTSSRHMSVATKLARTNFRS